MRAIWHRSIWWHDIRPILEKWRNWCKKYHIIAFSALEYIKVDWMSIIDNAWHLSLKYPFVRCQLLLYTATLIRIKGSVGVVKQSISDHTDSIRCDINWIKKIKISRYGDLLPKSVISVEVPDWHIDLLLVPVYKFSMVRFSEPKCCVTLRGRF